ELIPTGEATLYYAWHTGRVLAAAIVIDLGTTRYYAYAASSSDPEVRRLSPAAPLVWRAILDARAEGKAWFDFWGVAPPDQPDHPWSGFTQFKRSFGGMLLTRAGTWDLPVRPWLYRTWSAAQKLRRCALRPPPRYAVGPRWSWPIPMVDTYFSPGRGGSASGGGGGSAIPSAPSPRA